MLLLLFAVTAVIISLSNRNNIRYLYEANYTERVLVTNAMMAAVIESNDVNYFVQLLKNQDDEFRQRQIQFYHDRTKLRELYASDGPQNQKDMLLSRLMEFYCGELSLFKNEKYWSMIEDLNQLKKVSHSEYLYVMADIGLVNNNGDILYVFILDADDVPDVFGVLGPEESIYVDGLGTSDISIEGIDTVYSTKTQMDWVEYYNDVYGELYYAYAPILDGNGDVIAVLGTDLSLNDMNAAISNSVFTFNAIFLTFFIIIILFIFLMLRRNITIPLGGLTVTARELALGNVYWPVPENALKQSGEIGILASAINDMSFTYKEMISSAGKLFEAAKIGRMDVRNDAGKFRGDIQNVVMQINNTLDSMTFYLNNMPESILIMGRNLETYFRNDQFYKKFGLITAQEFMSLVFGGGQNEPADESHVRLALNSGIPEQDNNITVWLEDSCFSVIFREITLPDENENSILAVAVDITDLMNEKNNAQAAAKAKSDFLSRMSHEMRTPMNAIIGMTKIAETTDDILKLKYCLATIGTSSGHLLGIINDILDMSKIEAGKIELDIVPMNIEKTMMKVCNIIIGSAEKKNQKLNVFFAKNLDFSYIADDLRLTQVLTNLLSNAVKFTPEGGRITLTVETAEKNDGYSILRFSVIDTGIGMTEEQTAKLFRVFEQADGGVSRKFGGTGLGLAISKNIVEKMDGRIWADSEPGKGSVFSFEINVKHASHQEVPFISRGLKLLVVESDDDTAKNFMGITGNFGIHADLAMNSAEMINLANSAAENNRPYDIVYLDINIPDIYGTGFLNRLAAVSTIYIVSTYQEWNRFEKTAAESNITRHITKPIFPSLIINSINEIKGNPSVYAAEIKTAADQLPDFSGVKMILAEDVDINREIFIALLEPTNIEIEIAENGVAAVGKFAKNPDRYDLIIMDVQMPEMDGYEATRRIRAMNFPKAKSIPIIALSANVFKEDIERCLASGMNDHLGKPIDEKSVIEKIKHFLEK